MLPAKERPNWWDYAPATQYRELTIINRSRSVNESYTSEGLWVT